MAFTKVGSAYANVNTGGTSVFTTAAVDTTGADLLVVIIGGYNGSPPTFTDSKGNTWTALTVQSNSYNWIKIYYCDTAGGATVGSGHTVTGTSYWGVLAFLAFSGSASSAYDQESGSNTTGGVTTYQPGSITPSENGCLLVSGGLWAVSTNFSSIDSGFTSDGTIKSVDSQFELHAAYYEQATAAAINPTTTYSASSNYANEVMASFKPAAGAATGQPIIKRVGGVPFMAGLRQTHGVNRW